MIHNEGAYGNGTLEFLKLLWCLVGVGDPMDGKLKHPSKLISGMFQLLLGLSRTLSQDLNFFD